MSEPLYQHVLILLQDIEESSFTAGKASFQYILTTTTPPPESLASSPYLVLELKPDKEDTLLFRKRFDVAKQDRMKV